jgi:hypothetical protein
MVGLAQRSAFLPNPPFSLRIISCRHRHCPARRVSWHQSRMPGCLGVGRQRKPARNPIGAQRYLTISPLSAQRHSAWRPGTTSAVEGLRRRSGSEFATHWWPFALIIGRFSRLVIVACARSSSPNPFPCFSTFRAPRGGHEAATACAPSPGNNALAHLSLSQLPRVIARGGPQAALSVSLDAQDSSCRTACLSAPRSPALPPAAPDSINLAT